MKPTKAAHNSVREAFENPIPVEPMSGFIGGEKTFRNCKAPSDNNEMSEVSDLSEMSSMSEVSRSPHIDPTWSEVERDIFEERAAILEFDAGFSRGRAEFYAKDYLSRTHSGCDGKNSDD